MEFGKACEDLSWNHCTSTPHRSETNGIAERAVRRVKQGTSAVLLQSGLNESWWADSMECYAYLRNVTDLLSDGKSPYERRFGEPFNDQSSRLVHFLWNAICEMSKDLLVEGEIPYERRFGEPFNGPIIPFRVMVEYCPISARDQSKLHQFGKKVLPGIFLGYVLIAKGIWKGDILVADIADLDMMDASDIYPRRIKAKEVLISQKDEEFVETTNSEYPLQGAIKLWGVKILVENFEANQKVLNRQNQETTLQPGKTFGRFKVTSSIVITMNFEFNYVPKEETFPIPLNTLM